MATPGIKKAVFRQEDLPEINVELEGYLVRYRIVSEDRNRTSHWSPLFLVKPGYSYVTGSTSIGKSADHVNLIWDPVQIYKNENLINLVPEYDIWLRWDREDGGEWSYKERITSTSSVFIIPSTYFIEGVDQQLKPNKLTAEIFLKGTPVTRDKDLLKMYTVGPTTV